MPVKHERRDPQTRKQGFSTLPLVCGLTPGVTGHLETTGVLPVASTRLGVMRVVELASVWRRSRCGKQHGTLLEPTSLFRALKTGRCAGQRGDQVGSSLATGLVYLSGEGDLVHNNRVISVALLCVPLSSFFVEQDSVRELCSG